MNYKKLITLASLVSLNVNAANLAVIDSGTDIQHPDLISKIWINPVDSTVNNTDEDKNGYMDDVFGWNFFDGNNQVIDYKYGKIFDAKVERFYDLQNKMVLGGVTDEDVAWYEEVINDEEFLKNVDIFGNYMHGTHVAGIMMKDLESSKLLSVKIIPTDFDEEVASAIAIKSKINKGLKGTLVKFGLKILAKLQTKELVEISKYIKKHNVEIANGSFGTGYFEAKGMVEMILVEEFGMTLSEEQKHDYAMSFLKNLEKSSKKMVKKARKTLFVFAAGNDGTNNDELPATPANIRANNVISVAATFGFDSLADFSNYGVKTVDVAAPGVAIESTKPDGGYMRVSGTSQAAPYVANVAGLIKEANEGLKVKEVKQIIMETVTRREWLVGKVVSSGIIHKERAVYAAKLTLMMDVSDAISQANNDIEDIAEGFQSVVKPRYLKGLVRPLPRLF